MSKRRAAFDLLAFVSVKLKLEALLCFPDLVQGGEGYLDLTAAQAADADDRHCAQPFRHSEISLLLLVHVLLALVATSFRDANPRNRQVCSWSADRRAERIDSSSPFSAVPAFSSSWRILSSRRRRNTIGKSLQMAVMDFNEANAVRGPLRFGIPANSGKCGFVVYPTESGFKCVLRFSATLVAPRRFER